MAKPSAAMNPTLWSTKAGVFKSEAIVSKARLVTILSSMLSEMKIILLFSTIFFSPQLIAQEKPVESKPVIREGAKIIGGIGVLSKKSKQHPATIKIHTQNEDGFSSFILFPNKRLEEMEATCKTSPSTSFKVSGDIYTHAKKGYLLVRSVVSINDTLNTKEPSIIVPTPIEVTVDRNDDSAESIIKGLEKDAGTLTKTIRSASKDSVSKSAEKEGTRIASRRCHIHRNKHGAWVAVFVSDTTSLNNPPCIILPVSPLTSLAKWARNQHPSSSVLLSGELLHYHGHAYLLLDSWRPTHNTDHLDN